MDQREALEDIGYIKSLCKEARESLYSWKPFFLLFALIWMVGMLIPSIPGITTKFSVDGKHWPLLVLVGLAGTWIIQKSSRRGKVPFMMKVLIWNWALLFFFAVAVLFWNTGGYTDTHMYNYWMMVVGVAFMMTGVTLQTTIGWLGLGFFGVSILSDMQVYKLLIYFKPFHHVDSPVIMVKAILGGILLLISWWIISRKKVGASVE